MRRWGPLGGYVTGRTRENGEMNGKSANVNNCLKNYIFAKWVQWAQLMTGVCLLDGIHV